MKQKSFGGWTEKKWKVVKKRRKIEDIMKVVAKKGNKTQMSHETTKEEKGETAEIKRRNRAN